MQRSVLFAIPSFDRNLLSVGLTVEILIFLGSLSAFLVPPDIVPGLVVFAQTSRSLSPNPTPIATICILRKLQPITDPDDSVSLAPAVGI